MVTHGKVVAVCSIAVAAVSLAGCGSGESGPRKSMSDVGAQIEAQDAAQTQREQAKAEADKQAAEAQAATAAANQPPAEKPRTEAGRASLGEGGYLVAIAGARRHVLNTVDDLAWTQAVQHFQATEGRLPKDHNEFMKKIVEPLGIDLGFKEEGQEFLYDPTPDQDHPWGTLYVVEAETPPAPAPTQ
jgi:hypothetical protein